MGASGSGSGLESIYFSSDGGVIVGGYVEATGPIGDMVFKSSGIITEAKPFIAKISASDYAGSSAPTSWVWSHTETDATYAGSTKSMRLDSNDNIYANVGTRTSVIKLAGSDGSIVWRSGQIDAAVQSNDLELITSTGGMVLIGHHFGTTTEGCVGNGCSVIKGAMIELNADGTKAWGPKFYGNYRGGHNQFFDLDIGNWALIYTECWGITTTFDASTNAPNGYAFACGTGIENCLNE